MTSLTPGSLTPGSLTLGIEEEDRISDPETREPSSYVQEFLDEGRRVVEAQVEPEFLRSRVEVGSRIGRNLRETLENGETMIPPGIAASGV